MDLDIKALQAKLDKDFRMAFEKSRWGGLTSPDNTKEYSFNKKSDEPIYLIKEFVSEFMAQFYDKTTVNFSNGPIITKDGELYELKAIYKIW